MSRPTVCPWGWEASVAKLYTQTGGAIFHPTYLPEGWVDALYPAVYDVWPAPVGYIVRDPVQPSTDELVKWLDTDGKLRALTYAEAGWLSAAFALRDVEVAPLEIETLPNPNRKPQGLVMIVEPRRRTLASLVIPRLAEAGRRFTVIDLTFPDEERNTRSAVFRFCCTYQKARVVQPLAEKELVEELLSHEKYVELLPTFGPTLWAILAAAYGLEVYSVDGLGWKEWGGSKSLYDIVPL